jgi:hypothetical protein
MKKYDQLLKDYKEKTENLKDVDNKDLILFLESTTRWIELVYKNDDCTDAYYKLQDIGAVIKAEILVRMGGK